MGSALPIIICLSTTHIVLQYEYRAVATQIERYKVSQNELPMSHLLYADDVLIFTNASERFLKNFMQLLTTYR